MGTFDFKGRAVVLVVGRVPASEKGHGRSHSKVPSTLVRKLDGYYCKKITKINTDKIA
jgi:hypothetical protein